MWPNTIEREDRQLLKQHNWVMWICRQKLCTSEWQPVLRESLRKSREKLTFMLRTKRRIRRKIAKKCFKDMQWPGDSTKHK